uniref:Uncharacterized protein n=1 Tax=Lotharella oceanica TaxID=641309 RepID=A0A7S2TN81_9EUKA|mmetsp:Transcript_19561/g.36825  ORF Transcript_19561/g.36825 Transcript_19561/m.36825 type:complete len:224 (+) Transcript_19561:73-744(+)
MAAEAVGMQMAKDKLTGHKTGPISAGFKATKAEMKAQLLNNDEDSQEEMKKAKEVSCWDQWKYRAVFFIGCGLGAAFIGVALNQEDEKLNIMYGIFWFLFGLFAFGLNWNFASMLSLYNSANQIEETYRKAKDAVHSMKNNNDKYKEENEKLATNVGELKKTQGKLTNASKLLQGEVADLKKIQEKVVEMNERTFSMIKERETISGKQRRMITMQKEEQVLDF